MSVRKLESGLSSATVITECGLYGDSLSTALFVLGKEKSCDLWKKYHDFEMILITEKNEIYYTEGLSECISFYDSFSKKEMIVKEIVKQYDNKEEKKNNEDNDLINNNNLIENQGLKDEYNNLYLKYVKMREMLIIR